MIKTPADRSDRTNSVPSGVPITGNNSHISKAAV